MIPALLVALMSLHLWIPAVRGFIGPYVLKCLGVLGLWAYMGFVVGANCGVIFGLIVGAIRGALGVPILKLLRGAFYGAFFGLIWGIICGSMFGAVAPLLTFVIARLAGQSLLDSHSFALAPILFAGLAAFVGAIIGGNHGAHNVKIGRFHAVRKILLWLSG